MISFETYRMKPSAEITNYELVDLIRTRSRTGYEMLYKNYAQNLYNAIRTIVNNDTIAEDLLQDTFVKIWQNIDRYDENKGTLYTWMINIARNASIDKLRSKGEIMKSKIQTGEDVV